MSVLRNRPSPAQPTPQPVRGTARWLVTIGEADHGILEINGRPYGVTVLRRHGALVGYRLIKADGTTYDIAADGSPWLCDCPWACWHPEQPGGCKHVLALQAALAGLKQ